MDINKAREKEFIETIQSGLRGLEKQAVEG